MKIPLGHKITKMPLVSGKVAASGGELFGNEHHCPVDMRKVGVKLAASGGHLFDSEHH